MKVVRYTSAVLLSSFFFIFYDMFPSVFNNCDEACMLMAVRIMLFVSVTKIIHILWRNDLNQSI